jgi:hypothetical protein
MLKSTEQQLSDSAKVLQDILTAAADGQGEWYLPLEPAKVGGGAEACGDACLLLWTRERKGRCLEGDL